MQSPENATQKAAALTQEMLTITAPEGIFRTVVQAGGSTVITASEATAAMGVGSAGPLQGGGGTASGRPVAVIRIDPNGKVGVVPVLDATKIALALFTALSSFLVILAKLRGSGS